MLIDEFIIRTKNAIFTEKILFPQNDKAIEIETINRFNIEKKQETFSLNLETIYNKGFSLSTYTIYTKEEINIEYQLSTDINFIFVWDAIKNIKDINSIDSFISGDINIVFDYKSTRTIKIKKNSSAMFSILSIEKLFFLDTFKNDYYIKHFPLFKNVNSDLSYQLGSNTILKITTPVKNIISKCFHNPFEDKLEAFYIFSKIHGLISLIHEMQIETKSESLTGDTITKLNEARLILTENLVSPPTIKNLSKMVALNELKLKQGFKELFGCTIHNYSIKLRMEKAQSLMNESNLLIFEVAILLGYKDTSHFINVFKKYFGYTPKFFCTKIKTINIANE